jgi:pyridoxamine 5'-phosphate oxidase
MSENALTSGDFTEENEPYALFGTWLEEAAKTEPNDPNAVALATVDETGLPNVRMVLLKGSTQRGFVFYTNFESQPRAWKSLAR